MKTEFDRLQTDFAWSHHICDMIKGMNRMSRILILSYRLNRGNLLPQKAQKLAWFVLYLKIVNIFLKNNICIL